MDVIVFTFTLTLQRGLLIALGLSDTFELFSFILNWDRIKLVICNLRIIDFRGRSCQN